jgi:hypothetical protein
MPYQPIQPLKTPVKLSFPDGTELTSLFDPATNLLLADMHIRKEEEKAILQRRLQILTGKNMISQALKVCWK